MEKVTLERRAELVAEHVTLDGVAAKVSGTSLDFARVSALPCGPSYEWAWETVDRIVRERDGKFQS